MEGSLLYHFGALRKFGNYVYHESKIHSFPVEKEVEETMYLLLH